MTTRSLVIGVVLALAVAWSVPVGAQQAKCLAGKTKCMAKAGTGLLKCHQLAETPGKLPDPNAGGCVDKVDGKFDGGIDPTKGCFEKLENKSPNDCLTFDDTLVAWDEVDSCVGAFVGAIDPAPITPSKCDAGKKKCVSKLLKGLLKCRQLSQTPGKPVDPNTGGCVDKAVAKYTGGIDPAKGCFAKLEAKMPNDCQFTNDSSTLQGLVEDCVDDLTALVLNPTTTSTSSSTSTTVVTTSTSTTTTTAPGSGTELKIALTPTAGRFNYMSMIGLPAADTACNANFPGTHACTYQELQIAEGLGDLMGLRDLANNLVTTFWAIDNARPPLEQCQDDSNPGGSLLNWEYPTAHTPSRGDFVDLTNSTGDLGPLQMDQQCNFTQKSVGCCV